MSATADIAPTDARARRNVLVLVAAQALIGAQMPMIFTIAGLAGQSLAGNPCFATLPISMIVMGSMLTANPMSWVMQRWGRRSGFWLGTGGGAVGRGDRRRRGCISTASRCSCFGSLLTGIYMSAQGFYRFAATDTASAEFRPKAISYVMAGGLVSAFVGPQLVKLTAEALRGAVPRHLSDGDRAEPARARCCSCCSTSRRRRRRRWRAARADAVGADHAPRGSRWR